MLGKITETISCIITVMLKWTSSYCGGLLNKCLRVVLKARLIPRAVHNRILIASFRNEQHLLKKKCILHDVEEWQSNLKSFSTTWKPPPPSFDDDEIVSASKMNDTRPYKMPYVIGTDISFIKDNDEDACVAVVVLKLPELEVVYEDISMVKLTLPYIPGYLAFREAEFSVEKINKFKEIHPELTPLAIMVDGNGTLHNSEFGLACHIGVMLDMVTIGVAKTLFLASHLKLGYDDLKCYTSTFKNAGDMFPLVTQTNKALGAAFKSTKDSTNPIYVSPGHKISLDSAIELVKLCCKHRVPEPVRQADIRSRQYIRDHCMN